MSNTKGKVRWDEYVFIAFFLVGVFGALWLCFREEKDWSYLISSFLSRWGNF